MRASVVSAALAASLFATPVVAQDTVSFIFADVGTSHTGFFGIIPAQQALVGREVMLARILFTIDVAPGSDAANIDADLVLPIQPAPGASPLVSIVGSDLGWSGSGRFTHMIETTAHNGVLINTIFGASTFAGIDDVLDPASGVELVLVPAPGAIGLLAAGGLVAMGRRRR